MKKKLYKSPDQKILCGVCGGVAEYFEMDPTIVRLIWIALVLGVGIGFWLYIIAAIIVPKRPLY